GLQAAITVWPAEHPPVAFGSCETSFPTCPQLCGSVETLTSHPSDTMPFPSAKPALQAAITAWPADHPPVAFGRCVASFPTCPHLCGSVMRSMPPPPPPPPPVPPDPPPAPVDQSIVTVAP